MSELSDVVLIENLVYEIENLFAAIARFVDGIGGGKELCPRCLAVVQDAARHAHQAMDIRNER